MRKPYIGKMPNSNIWFAVWDWAEHEQRYSNFQYFLNFRSAIDFIMNVINNHEIVTREELMELKYMGLV